MDDSRISLKFNNQSSAEFGCYLQYPFNLVHAKKDVSGSSVPGVDGDFISDNLRYSNVTQQLVFFVERNPIIFDTWEQLEFDFMDWLSQGNAYTQYKPFYLDFLNPYHWLAYMSEAPVWSITNSINATVTITLNCKPYLEWNDNYYKQCKPIVYNQENIAAHPLWHIVADGMVDLKLNLVNYHFENIDGEIYVDTEKFLVYKSLDEPRGTVATFPNNDFPIFTPGENTINYIGDKIQKIEYKPNWRRLL